MERDSDELLSVRGDASHPTRTFPRSRTSWILTALVVLGAVLRFWRLGSNRLGFDESFTAMAGRLPVGSLFALLGVRDSHPPLDYLFHAPLARAGVDEFWFRVPSVACSIGAVALFAWWMRHRGLAGIVATGLVAVSAFQLVHGREARMYADLELIGVAVAVLTDSWLRRPRAWQPPAIGALVFVGLMTHTSMFLLGAGLLLVPGRRTDRDAWRWRMALAAGLVGWAILWGPTFLMQAQGGHSDWIPRTTVSNMIHTYGRLVAFDPTLHVPALLAVAGGAWFLIRQDRRLGRVWVCCALAPAALAAATGAAAPVLLDRTLTVVAWGPLLAIAYLVGAAARRARLLAACATLALVVVMMPPALSAVSGTSGPDRVLRHLEQVVGPGDVVALHPSGRLHELLWSVGVRGTHPYAPVEVAGVGDTTGVALDPNRVPSGRLWLVDWSQHHLPAPNGPRCANDWARAGARVYCITTVP